MADTPIGLDGRRFGLKGPDPKDDRDFRLHLGVPVDISRLPEEVDLSARCRPWQDQSVISGCVGWAYEGCRWQNEWAAQGHRGRKPSPTSPAFVYRECRALDEATEPGSLAHDWGTYVRNAWKVGNRLGAPLSSNYPPLFRKQDVADPSRDYLFHETSVYRRSPPVWVYSDAERRQGLAYFRCVTLGDALKSLADGYAVQFGFMVRRSFYGPFGPRYDVPMPSGSGDEALGGHSVYMIGYRRSGREARILCRNSWGAEAHLRDDGTRTGDFTLPFDYMPWLSDLWSGRRFE